jgi:hypothetical protein
MTTIEAIEEPRKPRPVRKLWPNKYAWTSRRHRECELVVTLTLTAPTPQLPARASHRRRALCL